MSVVFTVIGLQKSSKESLEKCLIISESNTDRMRHTDMIMENL